MGMELVRIASQWAGAVAVLALVGCFLTATVAVDLSRAMLETADDAFQLVRRLALLGGACVIVAALMSTFYWWRVGVASAQAAIAVGLGVGLLAVAFALVTRRICRPA